MLLQSMLNIELKMIVYSLFFFNSRLKALSYLSDGAKKA